MSAPSPIPPLDVITATFGPFVTGIMLQQLFMGVFCVQVYDYFRMFPKDPGYLKGIVAALTIVSTLQAVMDYKILYRCSVTFYGNFDKFDDTDWTLWLEIVVTAILGSIAQTFFLARCWSATKSKIVVAIGALAIIVSLVAGTISTVKFAGLGRLSLVPLIPTPITLWLVSTAVIDVAIALVLVVALFRMKTPFKKTEALITKMIRVTMETSSVTALVAVVNLVLYLALPGKAFHLLPQLSMGKMYAISVMVTLASRKELRDIMEQADHASYIASTTARFQSGGVQGIKVTTSTTMGDPGTDIELAVADYPKIGERDRESEEEEVRTMFDRKKAGQA